VKAIPHDQEMPIYKQLMPHSPKSVTLYSTFFYFARHVISPQIPTSHSTLHLSHLPANTHLAYTNSTQVPDPTTSYTLPDHEMPI
jgi:hypothetical protein